jgi:chromate transporter
VTASVDVGQRERTGAPLREIAALFLKLGTTAFGGPAAHIAMMEEEVVRRRGWLTHEEFLDYLGATNLIPGPNSTELAIHVGQKMAGWAGLIVAGACFILPAAVIVSVIAWAYVRFGTLPQMAGVLAGIKPVVIAIVMQAMLHLGHRAIKSPWLAVLGVGSLAAAALGVNELVVLAAAGVLAAIRVAEPRANARFAGVLVAGVASPTTVGLWPLFLVFAKIGAVLFGSGYVLIAFIRADLVERLHWLTDQQLIDAIAVGQVTPGPVFTTATFVGYVLAGGAGAAAATIGIFLPAFVFVALSGPLVPRLRRSRVAGAVLDGVNVASLALMTLAAVEIGRAAINSWISILILVAALGLVLRTKINSAWLVGAGAAIGLIALR